MKRLVYLIISFGVVLVLVGIFGLVLGFIGIFDFDLFAFGLSSGVRVIGSVAISGCLFCAIGFGWLEYRDHR